MKREMMMFTITPTIRALEADESYVYDRVCTQCRTPRMIGLWSWQKYKYIWFRCSNTECEVGNENDDD